jgi:hypothetical protein
MAPIPVLERILRGDPGKESRFRDFEGRLPPPQAWLYLPRSLGSALRWKLLHRRGAIPWLGYRGIRRIASIVGPGTRVLEFGAGMSTLWFARRGAEVLSVEADRAWFETLQTTIRRKSLDRVRLQHATPPYRPGLIDGQGFDFALVDGEDRAGAMQLALSSVRPGGYVYLDNADVPWPGHRSARDQALAQGEADWFVDFTPFHVFVSTGLLVHLVGRQESSSETGDGQELARPDPGMTTHA